jgi:osomolarity two-component system response regulator SKN7
VKNTDENAYGEHCWTFRHPKFRIHDLEGMENIKRKSAPIRKSTNGTRAAAQSQACCCCEPSPRSAEQRLAGIGTGSTTIHEMQSHINQLVSTQEDMKAHINKLESDYRRVLDEMVNMHRTMSTQDTLIQNLLSNFLNGEL